LVIRSAQIRKTENATYAKGQSRFRPEVIHWMEDVQPASESENDIELKAKWRIPERKRPAGWSTPAADPLIRSTHNRCMLLVAISPRTLMSDLGRDRSSAETIIIGR
jgi:hypothetical protein